MHSGCPRSWPRCCRASRPARAWAPIPRKVNGSFRKAARSIRRRWPLPPARPRANGSRGWRAWKSLDWYRRDGGGWLALDAKGATLASAAVAIVANAADAPRLAGLQYAPVQQVRGQLSMLPAGVAPEVALPVIGDGYLIPFADGSALTGATYDPDDLDPMPREAYHRDNLARLAALLPRAQADAEALTDPASLAGRVAFRCVASDRLPLAGALGDEAAAAAGARALSGAQARDVPRATGLYGAFGCGSHGFVWAWLATELIASQLEGEPWPIERELAEAIDPARFLLRALRQGRVG